MSDWNNFNAASDQALSLAECCSTDISPEIDYLEQAESFNPPGGDVASGVYASTFSAEKAIIDDAVNSDLASAIADGTHWNTNGSKGQNFFSTVSVVGGNNVDFPGKTTLGMNRASTAVRLFNGLDHLRAVVFWEVWQQNYTWISHAWVPSGSLTKILADETTISFDTGDDPTVLVLPFQQPPWPALPSTGAVDSGSQVEWRFVIVRILGY